MYDWYASAVKIAHDDNMYEKANSISLNKNVESSLSYFASKQSNNSRQTEGLLHTFAGDAKLIK